MAEFSVISKRDTDIKDKARIYFTCHPADFDKYFEKIVADIIHVDPAIYYTTDMTEPLSEEDLSLGIGKMHLVIVPVTYKLLSTPNRAMDVDIQFAKRAGMRILPIMMEERLDNLYSDPGKFGNRQYINPNGIDDSALSYEKRLSEYIADVTIDTELLRRVRAAFDTSIFLSYRKKDRTYANTLMKFIHALPGFRDVAIWYDEYIRLGEDFRENIEGALQKSEVFLLLVTPSILEDPNFVKDEEYKAANGKKPILPIEMVETDKKALSDSFENIPECAQMEDGEIFLRLSDLLSENLNPQNDNDPEHLYLIGLAYLWGIDSEVERERGLSMLKESADMGYPEAMEFIFDYLHDNAEYENALPYIEKLYNHYLNTLGGKDVNTLQAATTLASSYRENNIYDKALEFGEKSLYDFRDLFGEWDIRTLSALNTLAEIYKGLGKFDDAIELYERAHNIVCEKYGNEHTYSIIELRKLYKTCADAGYHEKALQLNKDAYDACEKVYDETMTEHISIALDLSDAYQNVKEFESALLIAQKTFTVALETYGKDHILTLAADGKATTLAKHFIKSNPKLATEIYMRSYLLCSEVYGAVAEETLARLLCLCNAYLESGDVNNQTKYMRKYYDIHCMHFGNDDQRTLKAATLFAKSLYYDAKNTKDAIKIAKQT